MADTIRHHRISRFLRAHAPDMAAPRRWLARAADAVAQLPIRNFFSETRTDHASRSLSRGEGADDLYDRVYGPERHRD